MIALAIIILISLFIYWTYKQTVKAYAEYKENEAPGENSAQSRLSDSNNDRAKIDFDEKDWERRLNSSETENEL